MASQLSVAKRSSLAQRSHTPRGVKFREVDVARDPAAARDLVRRTGQMGVRVVEIDGKPIVGFDQAKVDQLLGLKSGTPIH